MKSESESAHKNGNEGIILRMISSQSADLFFLASLRRLRDGSNDDDDGISRTNGARNK